MNDESDDLETEDDEEESGDEGEDEATEAVETNRSSSDLHDAKTPKSIVEEARTDPLPYQVTSVFLECVDSVLPIEGNSYQKGEDGNRGIRKGDCKGGSTVEHKLLDEMPKQGHAILPSPVCSGIGSLDLILPYVPYVVNVGDALKTSEINVGNLLI
ncbi:hypothetical protein U1Q18_023136 [Sarracenia purpurea var. burkii]